MCDNNAIKLEHDLYCDECTFTDHGIELECNAATNLHTMVNGRRTRINW